MLSIKNVIDNKELTHKSLQRYVQFTIILLTEGFFFFLVISENTVKSERYNSDFQFKIFPRNTWFLRSGTRRIKQMVPIMFLLQNSILVLHNLAAFTPLRPIAA